MCRLESLLAWSTLRRVVGSTRAAVTPLRGCATPRSRPSSRWLPAIRRPAGSFDEDLGGHALPDRRRGAHGSLCRAGLFDGAADPSLDLFAERADVSRVAGGARVGHCGGALSGSVYQEPPVAPQ